MSGGGKGRTGNEETQAKAPSSNVQPKRAEGGGIGRQAVIRPDLRLSGGSAEQSLEENDAGAAQRVRAPHPARDAFQTLLRQPADGAIDHQPAHRRGEEAGAGKADEARILFNY